LSVEKGSQKLSLDESLASYNSCNENMFIFLNLQHEFDVIDWNFSEYGKLWTYNLNYFEYLHQPGMTSEKGMRLINCFLDSIASVRDGLEPFPMSLRGINWIKFFIYHGIKNERADACLYAQYMRLMSRPEYHLLGNHLLENGFSLLFGGYYFGDVSMVRFAERLLKEQLNEQILPDGAHFELSPMYHSLMLFRVLDCVNLLKNNNGDLLVFMAEKAEKMLGWLKTMTYVDGSLPMLSDSAPDIAPMPDELFAYAGRLGLNYIQTPLNESGYRNVGAIGPDYMPGHAHADSLGFEMRVGGRPFIIDCGISTYQICDRRTYERGTSAHNTVDAGYNSSDVWGGFRVGKRAKTKIIIDGKDILAASHDGYKPMIHMREFRFSDSSVSIIDRAKGIARLHFHPDVTEEAIRMRVKTDSPFRISEYEFAEGYNKRKKALVIQIDVEGKCNTEISAVLKFPR